MLPRRSLTAATALLLLLQQQHTATAFFPGPLLSTPLQQQLSRTSSSLAPVPHARWARSGQQQQGLAFWKGWGSEEVEEAEEVVSLCVWCLALAFDHPVDRGSMMNLLTMGVRQVEDDGMDEDEREAKRLR